MSSDHEVPSEALPNDIPEGWMVVGQYSNLTDAEDHGLVALASGCDYGLSASSDGYRLLVDARSAAEVGEQLELFDRESAGWPPAPMADDGIRFRGVQFSPLVWVAVTVVVYGFQQDSAGRFEAAGALDASALFGRGEWWRPCTALFLHGGAGHLTTNLVAGYFVFAVVLSYFGRARGWLMLAVAAIGGNLLAAVIHYPGAYRSIGASTAIFGGLGLLTGRAWAAAVASSRDAWRWPAIFRPLAAGLVLLGLFGAGDAATDVVAHATGFAVGLGCGVLWGWIRQP